MKKIFFMILLLTLFTFTSCLNYVDIVKEGAIYILQKYTDRNDTANSDNTDNLNEITIQANISNWGYVASNGKDTYYFNGKDGIYKFNEDKDDELIVKGSYYSDIAIIDNTIYCIEYDDANKIIAIDIKTGDKEVIYAQPESLDTSLYAINIINDKYYFLVDNDNLFYISKNQKIKNTYLRSVVGITSSGIYTTNISNYGLKLVSESGNTIKEFPTLNSLEAYVNFELGDYIYAKIRNNDETQGKIYRIEKNTGEFSLFPNDEFYDSPDFEHATFNLNYYNDIFYISATCADEVTETDDYVHNIYTVDSDGNIKPLYRTESIGGNPLCTMGIADNYMFINFPFSSIESEIINLKTIS